jgi:malate dehydrogenase
MNAQIQGRSVSDVIFDQTWLQTNFLESVQKRGADIIKARGLSSAASAANGIIDTVRAIVTPTQQGQFFSLAVVSDGRYDIPEGLMFGFPVVSDGLTCTIVDGLQHGVFQKQKICITLQEIEEERRNVKEMLQMI